MSTSANTTLVIQYIDLTGKFADRPQHVETRSSTTIKELEDEVQRANVNRHRYPFHTLHLWKLNSPKRLVEIQQRDYIEKLARLNRDGDSMEFTLLDPSKRINDYPGWPESDIHIVAKYTRSSEGEHSRQFNSRFSQP